MKIEILYVPGCPNYQAASDAVKNLLATESLRAEIREVAVHTEAAAAALRFPGSPTIRINGDDVEPESAGSIGLACRLYQNRRGVPAETAIWRAMARAAEKQKCE